MNFLNKKIRLAAVPFIASFLLLSACGESSSNENAEGSSGGDSSIDIATLAEGTAFHVSGSGIASLIGEETPINATVNPYSGLMTWKQMMHEGDVDFGITQRGLASWAYTGYEEFDIPQTDNVRTVVSGNFTNLTGLAVQEDSGIDSLKDLEGKKVAAGYGGDPGTDRLAEIPLLSVGLSFEDVETVQVADAPSGVEALRNGRVDAAFVGVPTQGTNLEVDEAVGIKALNLGGVSPDNIDDFPQDFKERMQELNPGLKPVAFQGGLIEEEKVIYGYPIDLLAGSHVSEDTVYKITKTLWENYEKLHQYGSWLEDWNHDVMFDPNPGAPYHEGSVKYFKENDIWTEEAEQHQQQLLEEQ
ncbi:TAXI family TRAP transporter solute-binding subunit [Salibacterium sp. K-3]